MWWETRNFAKFGGISKFYTWQKIWNLSCFWLWNLFCGNLCYFSRNLFVAIYALFTPRYVECFWQIFSLPSITLISPFFAVLRQLYRLQCLSVKQACTTCCFYPQNAYVVFSATSCRAIFRGCAEIEIFGDIFTSVCFFSILYVKINSPPVGRSP